MHVSGRRTRRRVKLIVASWAILAAGSACSRSGKVHQVTLSASERATPLPARVRVLSGDALTVDGASVRLANAYAPQPVPYARCWAEALAASQAARALRGLIAEGRVIEVRTTPERDEFSRPLGYVTLDGADLGDTLYAMGLAARRTGAAFHWCEGFSEEKAGAPSLQAMLRFAR